ncbi:MAG: metalloregulator ArsR/SmtB family transcription factor [Pseudomonadota bacterium]
MSESLEQSIEVLKAIAEESRLRILAVCSLGELSVTELTRILGQSQPRVSRHLKVLLSAGLLLRFRERQSVLYRAVVRGDEGALIRQAISMIPVDDHQLARDRERLAEIRAERARAAASYLRFHAEDWHRLLDANIGTGEFAHAVLDTVQGVRGGHLGELLDIGTGTGRILKLLGRHAESAVGIDLDAEMLKVARAALHESGLDACAMVRQGDMYQLPFATASFDTVTMDQILFEAERPAQVVSEAARVLKADGCLLIVDFACASATKALDGGRQFGVRESDVEEWLRRAGLTSQSTTRLAGESLTVMLTIAQRAAARPQTPTTLVGSEAQPERLPMAGLQSRSPA